MLLAQKDGTLLTLIIAISPTPSALSTELISFVLDSFRTHRLNLFATLILVFDTYDRIAPTTRLKKNLRNI
jgi:hypothetical protein